MADELRLESRPALTDPVLIATFRGWNDGGQGASLAGGFLAKAWEAERFGDIDPEGFFDFQATRPHVSLVDGVTRDTCKQRELPSVSRWAAVPHYVSLTPNPRAAKAICDRLANLLDAELDTAELDEAIETYTEQVSEAVSSDPDTAAYVEELE